MPLPWYDAYMNSTNERHTALTALRALAPHGLDSVDSIIAYCDGDAPQGTLRTSLLATITGEVDPDFAEITATLEAISDIDSDFAVLLAMRAELCPLHYADPEICGDMHLPTDR